MSRTTMFIVASSLWWALLGTLLYLRWRQNKLAKRKQQLDYQLWLLADGEEQRRQRAKRMIPGLFDPAKVHAQIEEEQRRARLLDEAAMDFFQRRQRRFLMIDDVNTPLPPPTPEERAKLLEWYRDVRPTEEPGAAGKAVEG